MLTPTDELAPHGPWAMLLTDAAGDFWHLGFDFDPGNDPQRSQSHATEFSDLLLRRGIAHVVCASGRAGGRHIWIALHDPADPINVRHLAQLTKLLYPSLDTSPLSNARTGALRPPGAPHRSEHPSTVIRGDIDTLRDPWVSFDDIAGLITELSARVHETMPLEPHHVSHPRTPLPVDATGHLYMPGQREGLPAPARAALERTVTRQDDASRIAWTALLGCVRAGWHLSDIEALLPHAPGLEHLRTQATPSGRKPRPQHGAQSAKALLERQWTRAVHKVAASQRSPQPSTFDHQAGIVADFVEHQLDRIASCPGRWSGEAGHQDRDVLEELLLLALEGITLTVEAASRTLANRVHISHASIQKALRRLADEGAWLTLSETGAGHRANRWNLDPHNTVGQAVENSLPQAVPPLVLPGPQRRDLALQRLRQARQLVNDNWFSYGSPALKRQVGYLYRLLHENAPTTASVSTLTGLTPASALQSLHSLASIGGAEHTGGVWSALPLPANGELDRRYEQRRARYELERQQWAWWLAELDWMTAPRRSSQQRRPGRGQLSLLPGGPPLFPPYPRRLDGTADHRRARGTLKATGVTSPGALTVVRAADAQAA